MKEIAEDWTIDDGRLIRIFKCKDFKQAIAFINSIAEIAEKLQHHPDLCVKNYNEVFISTFTHNTNSITENDQKLVEEINKLIDYETARDHTEVNTHK